MIKIVYDQNSIPIVSNALYNYRVREESITRNDKNITRMDFFEAHELRLDFFKEKNDVKLYKYTLYSYLANIRIQYYRIWEFDKEKYSEELDILKNKFKKYKIKEILWKEAGFKGNIQLLLFYLDPVFYCKSKKIQIRIKEGKTKSIQ